MSAGVKAQTMFLAYDGDCPMCLATVGMLLRWGLVKPEQARANFELEGEEREAAERAGIRNQLVVFDPATGQTRPGSDGLLWIIGTNGKYRFLVWLLSLPGIRQIVRLKYETISYNRRIISPPRHQIVCDCEPEVTLCRRLMLIVPLILVTIGIEAGFGASVFAAWQLGPASEGAVFAPIAAGGGWLAMIIAALVLLRGMRAVDYIGHLSVTMYVGAMLIAPVAILVLVLPGGAGMTLAALAVLGGFALMFKMQKRRVAALRLSATWLWTWSIVVAVATVGCVASHFREQLL